MAFTAAVCVHCGQDIEWRPVIATTPEVFDWHEVGRVLGFTCPGSLYGHSIHPPRLLPTEDQGRERS